MKERFMSGVKRRFLGLCLPVILAGSLDATLTLCGQSPAYWAGDYQQVNELGGFLNQLLRIHPLAFIAFECFQFVVVSCFILLVTDSLALLVSIASVFNAVLGASTWILPTSHGYVLTDVLFLSAALLLTIGIRYGWQARPAEKYELKWLSPLWRGILALAITGVYVYLITWPH